MANRLKTWTTEVLASADLNAEFDNAYAGNVSRTAGYWGSNDDIPFYLGSSQDAQLEWNTDQTTDLLSLGLGAGNMLLIGEKGDMGTDYAIASQTNPTLIVHSADATTAKDYIWLAHDQTDANINVGAGGLKLKYDGTVKFVFGANGDCALGTTAVSGTAHLLVDGAFTQTTGNSVSGVRIADNLTAIAGSTAFQALLSAGGTVGGAIATQGQTETVSDVATMILYEPAITVGTGDTVTTASTLAIKSAPTEGSSNYALLVDAGTTRFDDVVQIFDGSTNAILTTVNSPAANDGNVLLLANATDAAALELDTQASCTAGVLHVKYNGTTAGSWIVTATTEIINANDRDLGNGNAGPKVNIGRNTNATGPGAGHLGMKTKSGTQYYVWVDDTGDLRVGTTEPTGANDLTGTVVGTQT